MSLRQNDWRDAKWILQILPKSCSRSDERNRKCRDLHSIGKSSACHPCRDQALDREVIDALVRGCTARSTEDPSEFWSAHSFVPGSKSFPRSSELTITGSNPASRTNWAAVS